MSESMKPVNAQDLFHQALFLSERYGWCVIPAEDKMPRVPSWTAFQTGRPDSRKLEQLFSEPRVNGLCVLSGEVSQGLAVMDFDERDPYVEWATSNPNLAGALPTDRTPRGHHVYFRSTVQANAKVRGGDFRGGAGITVIPPSMRRDGGVYEWLQEPRDEIPLINPVKAGFLPPQPPPTPTPPLLGNMAPRPQVLPNRVCGVCVPEYVQGKGGFRLGWCPPTEVRSRSYDCRPRRVGQRNYRIMEYVRSLRRLDVKWDQFRLRLAFSLWWGHAADVVGTKDMSVSWRDFVCAWKTCPDLPRGLDVVRLAKLAAGVELSPAASSLPSKPRRLLAACTVLQGAGDSFYLAGEDAGRLLGVTKMSGSRALKRLVREGYLARLAKGSNLTHTASSYRVVPTPRY